MPAAQMRLSVCATCAGDDPRGPSVRSAPGFRRPAEVGATEQRRPLADEEARCRRSPSVRVLGTNSFDAAIDNRGRQQRLAEDLEVFRVRRLSSDR